VATVSPAVEACPSCGKSPSTPLLCESCGELLEPRSAPSPFAVLGVAPAFAVDVNAARRRLLELSRALHPDFHAGDDAETRRLAEDNTAALNAAFRVLSDDFRRADWLVRSLGGPGEDEERAMPPEFLQSVLEWNETIEEARAAAPGSSERARLAGLAAELRDTRAATMGRVGALLTPLPAPGSQALRAARQELNALRYLDRALRELGELLLAARA
jgi:molecular chaperone HscB